MQDPYNFLKVTRSDTGAVLAIRKDRIISVEDFLDTHRTSQMEKFHQHTETVITYERPHISRGYPQGEPDHVLTTSVAFVREPYSKIIPLID